MKPWTENLEYSMLFSGSYVLCLRFIKLRINIRIILTSRFLFLRRDQNTSRYVTVIKRVSKWQRFNSSFKA